jgi:hypothetical protein
LARVDGPETRYLHGISAPLPSRGAVAASARRRSVAVATGLALVLPWGYGGWRLQQAWSNPEHADRVWEVPILDATIACIESTGARSAYASLQFAGRITLETRGTVVASQAWNERIPGDPLRFRDLVDLDPAPAWVLSSRLSRGMPRAEGFRERLRAAVLIDGPGLHGSTAFAADIVAPGAGKRSVAIDGPVVEPRLTAIGDRVEPRRPARGRLVVRRPGAARRLSCSR